MGIQNLVKSVGDGFLVCLLPTVAELYLGDSRLNSSFTGLWFTENYVYV